MTRHIHFVTGKLAAPALERVVAQLAPEIGFAYSIDVMPITVAALLTPSWIAPRIQIPQQATEILLPGYCDVDLSPLTDRTDLPVRVGPRELRALPEFFGRPPRQDYGDYRVEILAEINHAPRWEPEVLLAQARRYRDCGADVIDIGCDPQGVWAGLADCVKSLRDEGLRVSVDSFQPQEVEMAVRAGAELVLSVNASNREAAVDWGCEVVAIPDDLERLETLEATIDFLTAKGVPFRADPILEPIGCGFAASLSRYAEFRRRFPDAPMMMGIGNLTELTDVDSSGVNVLLLGYCEELGIHSVLTTEVISWAASSVRECDLARRLVHYAVRHGIPPKRLDDQLVCLRDPQLYPQGEETLRALGASLKDANYRIFAEGRRLHVLAADVYLTGEDPFDLFAALMDTQPKNLDLSHAFYLGYELAKAATALTLGKQYRQDQALTWGHLTQPEPTRRSAADSR